MANPPMHGMGDQYFLRIQGRVIGPFTVEKLKSLRARGQFGRFHEVSIDRQNWAAAATIEQLLTGIQQPAGSVGATSPELPGSTGPLDFDAERERRLVPGKGSYATPVVAACVLLSLAAAAYYFIPRKSNSSTTRTTSTERSRSQSSENTATEFDSGRSVVADLVDAAKNSLPIPSATSSDSESQILTSIDGDEADRSLANCVGLVVEGYHATMADGTIVESPLSTGSCFVINSDGFALTNKHVVESYQKMTRAELLRERIAKELLIKYEPRLWAFFGSKQYSCSIEYTSDKFDVAVVKIDGKFDRVLALSLKDQVPRGERVSALGFPGVDRKPLSKEEVIFEYFKKEVGAGNKSDSVKSAFKDRDFQFTRTDGSISRISKEQAGSVFVQHTAIINPGNSGGPLLTTDGVACGINTLKLLGDASRGEQSVFFAISVAQLKAEIDKHVQGIVWK